MTPPVRISAALPLALALAATCRAANDQAPAGAGNPAEIQAGPGQAAVRFLDKLRGGSLDLEPGGDTAISPQTVPAKRARIAKRLDRIARDLGSAELEIGPVREDGNFAAALVRKLGGFDPASLRVFAVALIRRDAGWAAAPLPASFENSGAGYAPGLRDRLVALENWMLREEVADLQRLRDDARTGLRRKIEARLSAETVRGFGPEDAIRKFLVACETRDLPSVLGLLGGLSADLPADWALRLRAAERSLAGDPTVPAGWRLLLAPEIARAILSKQPGDLHDTVPVGCLDPAAGNPASPKAAIGIVRLGIGKDAEGIWRIDLPGDLLGTETGESTDKSRPGREREEAFAKSWRTAHPAAPQESPEKLRDALGSALRSGSLADLLALVRLDGESGTASRPCLDAANLWWSIHDPSSLRQAIPLAVRTDDASGKAAGFYQIFLARDAARYDPQTLYFEKSATGWLWTPVADAVTRAHFRDWADGESGKWQDDWQREILGKTPVADGVADLSPPAGTDATRCVREWLAATKAGDIAAALGLFARFGDARSGTMALQNLGYEINGARLRSGPPDISGVWRDGPFAVVGVSIPQAEGGALHPLFPVIGTPAGPRILLEIDLFASRNRSRDYLNNASLTHLERAAGKPAADKLRGLLEKFQASVADSTPPDAADNN